MTQRQLQVLQFIEKFAGEYGFSPTVREIGGGVGLRSSSSVQTHLAALQRGGFITREPRSPRTIRLGPKAA